MLVERRASCCAKWASMGIGVLNTEVGKARCRFCNASTRVYTTRCSLKMNVLLIEWRNSAASVDAGEATSKFNEPERPKSRMSSGRNSMCKGHLDMTNKLHIRRRSASIGSEYLAVCGDCRNSEKDIPQWLKPGSSCGTCGSAKEVAEKRRMFGEIGEFSISRG
jgi:hypothetical protein